MYKALITVFFFFEYSLSVNMVKSAYWDIRETGNGRVIKLFAGIAFVCGKV